TTDYQHIDNLDATPPRRILGVVSKVTQTSTVRGLTSPPRVVQYDTDSNGLVRTETVEPTLTDTRHKVTTYHRDSLGQATAITAIGTVSAPSPAGGTFTAKSQSRTTAIEYDANGRTSSVTNPEGHRDEYVYDPRHGGVVAHRDANGMLTTQTYD